MDRSIKTEGVRGHMLVFRKRLHSVRPFFSFVLQVSGAQIILQLDQRIVAMGILLASRQAGKSALVPCFVSLLAPVNPDTKHLSCPQVAVERFMSFLSCTALHERVSDSRVESQRHEGRV